MPSAAAERILLHLQQVRSLREARAADPALAERLRVLKDYQSRRFERSYADLLADPRHAPTARFFLTELYGPQDFVERDAQFSRIVPALTRLFSAELVGTVSLLAELHALSETLDDAGARLLPAPPLDAPALDAPGYVRMWQAVGRPDMRARQIEQALAIGRAMQRYTSSRLLRHSLRLMRGPAKAAGLLALQRFLEAGFDAFGSMQGAEDFLQAVDKRERALGEALFAPAATAWAATATGGEAPARPPELAELP